MGNISLGIPPSYSSDSSGCGCRLKKSPKMSEHGSMHYMNSSMPGSSVVRKNSPLVDSGNMSFKARETLIENGKIVFDDQIVAVYPVKTPNTDRSSKIMIPEGSEIVSSPMISMTQNKKSTSRKGPLGGRGSRVTNEMTSESEDEMVDSDDESLFNGRSAQSFYLSGPGSTKNPSSMLSGQSIDDKIVEALSLGSGKALVDKAPIPMATLTSGKSIVSGSGLWNGRIDQEAAVLANSIKNASPLINIRSNL